MLQVDLELLEAKSKLQQDKKLDLMIKALKLILIELWTILKA